MSHTRIVCVCVSCGQKSPRSLDSFPYFPERKRNPANLFTFPKCQDKLGGLRVSAQSTRQLFYKKNVRVDFFFARPLSLPEDRAAPPPRKTWTSLVRRVRVGRALRRTNDRQATPRGWQRAAHQAGRAERRGRSRCGTWSGGARGGRDRRGSHPRMCIRSLVSPPPLSSFLKAKAVIYSPFRFSECSLRELDVQTPLKRAGEREVERARLWTRRPSALCAPGLGPLRTAPRAARTQKHKSVPQPTVAPFSRVLAASPPSLPLKGQQAI